MKSEEDLYVTWDGGNNLNVYKSKPSSSGTHYLVGGRSYAEPSVALGLLRMLASAGDAAGILYSFDLFSEDPVKGHQLMSIEHPEYRAAIR